jgi:membrane protease YdiL (CAAX protease family)
MSVERENMEARVVDGPARALALWEIASVMTSGLIAEWVVLSFVGGSKLVLAVPVLLSLALMIFSHSVRAETLRDVGFRTDNFLAACGLLVLPTLAVLLVAMFVSWSLNHSVIAQPFRARFLLLPIWALFQQYALNGFINRRAELALGAGTKSIALVAVLFSLFHMPNPLLAIITLAGGLIWAAVYQRRPNLYALALSHSVVSIFLALSWPSNLLNSLRVGFKFFG